MELLTTNVSGIQLISVVLAIVSLSIAYFIHAVKTDREQLKEQVVMLQKLLAYTESAVDRVAECTLLQERIYVREVSHLRRLLRKEFGGKWVSMNAALAPLKKEQKRLRNELLLHSTQPIRRMTASNNLSRGIGNANSLMLMDRLTDPNKLGFADYSDGIAELRNRIDNSLS